jgi:hypothetical protein
MESEIDFTELRRVYRRRPVDKYLAKLKAFGSDFYIRIGSECSELIFDGRHKVYGSKQNNFPPSKIFLFNLVKRDVVKFVQDNSFDVSPKQKTTDYNFKYDPDIGTVTATDLNHAYWRIAYVKDFDCWKTDCIYYRDTPENRKIVTGYFEEREMLFKQLVYDTSPDDSEEE